MLPPPIPDTSLAGEAERRYLNYALSVITSRALPDVRDGLKPVQRRILYAMHHDMRLGPDAKHRKSAAVVGEVMGKYHPHGDVAIYEAMARMAQSFSLRATLVDGHGNFGSPDGDSPAAMRYTEAKLRPLAQELLDEIDMDTVEFRPNYDNTLREPVVVPARFPNLLVNGSYGIAVGMATSIPPHNLGEVIDACVYLIDEPTPRAQDLLKFVKGPDFPTGGQLQVTKRELAEVYETGHGSLKLRGEWKLEPGSGRGDPDAIVITSIPFAVERKAIVEKIAEIILQKKLPALSDVRDESTEQVRVVLECKRGSDAPLVMAYLFKHTGLAANVQVNLTCLVPVEGAAVAAPQRLGLMPMLREFLDFRFATVTRRLEHELRELERRIHILEGFELVFDVLGEVIAIIRKSDGKADAAEKLVGRFGLSAAQADAILELRLYRLARLEILAIQRELAERRLVQKRLQGLLKSDAKRWELVRGELLDIKKRYGDKRRTRVVADANEPEFAAEDFIVDEDARVILCASGWVKRGRDIDVAATRLREGDSVLAAVAGSTRATVAFLSSHGVCYSCRIHDLPATTGYGEPIQSLFKLGDGERIVAALSCDARVREVPPPNESASEPEPPFGVAVTRRGLGMRFSLRPFGEPSTRAGRKFCRLNEGDEVIACFALDRRGEHVMCAASDGHAIAVECEELPILAGPGKGVMVLKLDDDAELLGAALGVRDLDAIEVETGKGSARSLTLRSLVGTRGGRGHAIVKRGGFSRFVTPPVETPVLEARTTDK
ncbi:MAG: DNA topoisomerase IV subunit A [Polyangiaceae bacterium]|nr:DNA topoisomerase IV subunit A [Polyangiaceae bacterium]